MERWVRDKTKADDRRAEVKRADLEQWNTLLGDIAGAGVRRAGLLLHNYSGPLDVAFDCTRAPAIGTAARIDQLGWIEVDVLTDFHVG